VKESMSEDGMEISRGKTEFFNWGLNLGLTYQAFLQYFSSLKEISSLSSVLVQHSMSLPGVW